MGVGRGVLVGVGGVGVGLSGWEWVGALFSKDQLFFMLSEYIA